ncbi:MAG TPA: AAA family ATPase [Candidatus Saccharimonadales bacterium]|nr:AAA family ATPase [Candidatus Saccharimonadales bacterium]
MKYPAFYTKLDSLPATETVAVDGQLPPEKQKKQARTAISLKYANESLGFLHACLIRLDGKHFALSGPSGAGKTTLAEFLARQTGAEIIANDWIAVETKAGSLYASDLNQAAGFKHETACKLDGLIILADHDELARDAFVPSVNDLEEFLVPCFDAMPVDSAKRLCAFWEKQSAAVPLLAIVPTRDQPLDRVKKTVLLLLERYRPAGSSVEVGVIGTGAVGSVLASELGKLPYVDKVHLYNRTKKAAIGLALDLNHAQYRGRDDIFVAHDSAADVFQNADDIFLVLRQQPRKQAITDMPDRWRRLIPHARTITKYARLASKQRFKGTIFVITNPVDILTYGCFAATQHEPFSLRSFQVYGIGMESDFSRALFYARRKDPRASLQNFKIFGNHADQVVCKTNLSKAENAEINKQVRNASLEIRKYAARTIYGPANAALRTYEAFIQNTDCGITVIQEQSHIGRHVYFRQGLPQLASRNTEPEYAEILSENRRRIKKYGSYFGL